MARLRVAGVLDLERATEVERVRDADVSLALLLEDLLPERGGEVELTLALLEGRVAVDLAGERFVTVDAVLGMIIKG